MYNVYTYQCINGLDRKVQGSRLKERVSQSLYRFLRKFIERLNATRHCATFGATGCRNRCSVLIRINPQLCS